MILKIAAKMTLQFLKRTNAIEYLNPYTVEWCLHYAEGSQKTKALPECLVNITRGQIACTLVKEYWAFDENTRSGIAKWYSYQGDSSYYTHPTMGVVGGFSYELVSFEDKFVVRCEDTWDFNPGFNYAIPLPDFCNFRILIKILKQVGIPISSIEDNSGKFTAGVSESWLTQFNEKHCFKTVWEVELPNNISCPINSPVKRDWERSQRRSRRFE
ncbi:MAG TPA: hypothetical protein V6C58_23330 [Allocoleopsis sp.]